MHLIGCVRDFDDHADFDDRADLDDRADFDDHVNLGDCVDVDDCADIQNDAQNLRIFLESSEMSEMLQMSITFGYVQNVQNVLECLNLS